jgi:hypothetical protein
MNIYAIANLAADPDCSHDLALAVADILDEIAELPEDDAPESLRAAQDAIYHGAWDLPREHAGPLMHELGRAVEGARA